MPLAGALLTRQCEAGDDEYQQSGGGGVAAQRQSAPSPCICQGRSQSPTMQADAEPKRPSAAAVGATVCPSPPTPRLDSTIADGPSSCTSIVSKSPCRGSAIGLGALAKQAPAAASDRPAPSQEHPGRPRTASVRGEVGSALPSGEPDQAPGRIPESGVLQAPESPSVDGRDAARNLVCRGAWRSRSAAPGLHGRSRNSAPRIRHRV
jgi:hypothetical protein